MANSFTTPTSKETRFRISLTLDTEAAGRQFLPSPSKETVWPVAGDNTGNLQAAVDRVSALPLDSYGFRGAVLIKMGYYKMATPLTVHARGVVLRGEGMGDTGTVLMSLPKGGANVECVLD